MSRLTVRLPDTLHAQLNEMAKSEGISLNQYIVYALTRQLSMAYTVRPTPASEAAEQRAAYAALLQGLGQASFEEVKAAMEEREQAPPEAEQNVVAATLRVADHKRRDGPREGCCGLFLFVGARGVM